MSAAAADVFRTVTTYTARSIRSRGKTPTSRANGLVRYVPRSGSRLVPNPARQFSSGPPARPCSRSHRYAWYGTNWLPRSFTARVRSPKGKVRAAASPAHTASATRNAAGPPTRAAAARGRRPGEGPAAEGGAAEGVAAEVGDGTTPRNMPAR